jgi:hypothetical protein
MIELSSGMHTKMKMLMFMLAAVICVFWSGCASASKAPDVATHYDRASGFRTDLIPDNLLETEQPTRELLWLNASRVFRSRDDFDYYLEVHYEALPETGYLDIRPGETLVVVADGHEMKFRGNGSANQRVQGDGVVGETALYLAGPNELRRIAEADRVVVRVIGASEIVERAFTKENAARFKKFVNRSVEGEE